MLYLDVSGTSFCIGETIGEHFNQRIKDYVKYRFYQMSKEFRMLGIQFCRSEYYDISSQLIQYTQKYANEEFQELMGISRATNIPIENIIFAVGYTDIFDLFLSRKGRLKSAILDINAECTTFIYSKKGRLFCGQNWDMDDVSANNICFIKKIYSNGEFIQGLSTVMGMIHIGINSNGTFIGTANLSSICNTPNGLIFPVTIQHLLRVGISDDSINWLSNTKKVGGHYFYILNNPASIFAVECDGENCRINSISDSYAHTNHYRENIYKEKSIIYSSDTVIRCDYISDKLSQNLNLDKIKLMLANHENRICRHSNTNSFSQTCASIIYDWNNHTIHLNESNPCMGNWHVNQINIRN